MAKKQNKPVKEETLETILFNCRNSLRGRAAMTDKRDLLLTLVFLKFIGERFKQQKEKIRYEIMEVQGIDDTDFIEVDYLNGQEIPNIRRMETPGTLGFVWDIYLDWGISVMDWRGAIKNPGVTIANPIQ